MSLNNRREIKFNCILYFQENEEEEEEEEEEDDLIEKDDKDVKFKEPSNQSVQIGKAEDGDDYSTASDMESGAGDGDDDKEGDEDGDDS